MKRPPVRSRKRRGSITRKPLQTRAIPSEKTPIRCQRITVKELNSFTFFHDCRLFPDLSACFSACDFTCRARSTPIPYFSATASMVNPFRKSAAILLLRAWTSGSFGRPPPLFFPSFPLFFFSFAASASMRSATGPHALRHCSEGWPLWSGSRYSATRCHMARFHLYRGFRSASFRWRWTSSRSLSYSGPANAPNSIAFQKNPPQSSQKGPGKSFLPTSGIARMAAAMLRSGWKEEETTIHFAFR